MKKRLTVLLCILLVACLFACGGTPESTPAPAPASSSAPAPPPAPEPEPEPEPEPASPAPASEAPGETEMESITYKDVTIHYPAGLEVMEDDESAGVLLEINVGALMVQEHPTMTGEEFDAMFETGENWDATAQMIAASMGGEVLENGEVDFAGGRAGYLRMNGKMDDIDVTIEVYIFSAGENLYMLMTMLTEEGEEKYGDMVRQMLDSIEVNW